MSHKIEKERVVQKVSSTAGLGKNGKLVHGDLKRRAADRLRWREWLSGTWHIVEHWRRIPMQSLENVWAYKKTRGARSVSSIFIVLAVQGWRCQSLLPSRRWGAVGSRSAAISSCSPRTRRWVTRASSTSLTFAPPSRSVSGGYRQLALRILLVNSSLLILLY